MGCNVREDYFQQPWVRTDTGQPPPHRMSTLPAGSRQRASVPGSLAAWAAAFSLITTLDPSPALAQPQAFPLPDGEVVPTDPLRSAPAAPAASPAVVPSSTPRPSAAAPAVLPRSQPRVAAAPHINPSQGFLYRLGPGDRLRMSVFMVEGYAAEVEVLSDGTINLPRQGSVPVAGLTMDEARQRITAGYDRYLRRPLVYLDLILPRPVRVTLVGEVQKPGFYSLTQAPSSANLQASGPAASGTQVQSAGWPTLVDAVQRAGGITAVADLSNVVLRRPNPIPGGPPVEFRFDYLRVLMEGGTTVNPLLNDGDKILVARAEGVQPNEVLIRTAASNFAPDTIGVTVVGEVKSPGLQQVRSNSPLAAAVMAAGDVDPLRANPKDIRLLRLESDGTVSARTIVFNPAAPLDSPSNPALHNGDVVVVPRNGWTRGNDFLAQAVSPLGPLLNAASLFRILSGN
jgi:Periplasmic protein involved in polysaccharide export